MPNPGPSRPVSRWGTLLPLPLLGLLAGGCVGQQPPSSSTLPLASPPRQASQELDPNLRKPASAGLGLQPLPSPEQVSASVALGRLDPFLDPRPPSPALGSAASASGSGASAAAGGTSSGQRSTQRPRGDEPQINPPQLQLTGVIQSGGQPSAIVQKGSNSGTLVPGERGGANHPLLPAGWSVESININAGSLTLRHGSKVYPAYTIASS